MEKLELLTHKIKKFYWKNYEKNSLEPLTPHSVIGLAYTDDEEKDRTIQVNLHLKDMMLVTEIEDALEHKQYIKRELFTVDELINHIEYWDFDELVTDIFDEDLAENEDYEVFPLAS